jgi:hypothetical protein
VRRFTILATVLIMTATQFQHFRHKSQIFQRFIKFFSYFVSHFIIVSLYTLHNTYIYVKYTRYKKETTPTPGIRVGWSGAQWNSTTFCHSLERKVTLIFPGNSYYKFLTHWCSWHPEQIDRSFSAEP